MPKVGDKDFAPQSETIQIGSDKEKVFSFVADEPLWSIDEIVLDNVTKDSITDAIVFCQQRKKIVDEWNLKRFLKGSGGCTGINMYGKPGTGKSIAAEAIAKAAGKKIIKVDYSEIQNEKWGGTEKKITELFKTAELTDSIIFFDEADGLLRKRQSDGANAETNNQIKAHLLTMLDKSAVIVIFATNRFQDYDRAFFRRILFHIKFPTPDKELLISLWKFHLGVGTETNCVPRDNNFSFEQLAEDSKGLTGGDVKNLTLKSCIRLVSHNLGEINNEMLKEEIKEYKLSLSDMGEERREVKTEKLEGKDAEAAKKLFDSTPIPMSTSTIEENK